MRYLIGSLKGIVEIFKYVFKWTFNILNFSHVIYKKQDKIVISTKLKHTKNPFYLLCDYIQPNFSKLRFLYLKHGENNSSCRNLENLIKKKKYITSLVLYLAQRRYQYMFVFFNF